VGGQLAPGRPAVGGVADHVDGAPVQRGGEQVDQGAGLLGLGGAGLGDVQAGQEGHGHHDPDDHKAVAAADAVASLGRAVVLVPGAVDLLAVAVKERVVHRDGDRAGVGHQAGHDRAGQCQADLVQVPHRARGEAVRARPVHTPGQARGLPHPGDGSSAGTRQGSGDQRGQGRERGRGEARP